MLERLGGLIARCTRPRMRFDGGIKSLPRPTEIEWRNLFELAHEIVLVEELRQPIFAQNFLDVNDHACAALGYQRDRLMALGLGSILWETDEAYRDDLAACLMSEKRFALELVLRTSSGAPLVVDANGGVFRLGGKVIIGMVGREKNAASLKALDNRYKSIYRRAFHESPHGTAVCTNEGRMLRFNKAFVALTHFSSAKELRAITNSDIRWLMPNHFTGKRADLCLLDWLETLEGPVELHCHNGIRQTFNLRSRRLDNEGDHVKPLMLISIDVGNQTGGMTSVTATRAIKSN